MSLPAHAPTDITRKQAQQAAGFGLPQDQIGALLGIDDKTLRKHYPDELALGRAMASAAVGESLFRRATSGEDTTAAIWWSKCRCAGARPRAGRGFGADIDIRRARVCYRPHHPRCNRW